MRNDPETRKTVHPTDIMQVVVDDDRTQRCELFVVLEVHSWGVVGWSMSSGVPQSYRQTWDRIEPTGGKAVIDMKGVRYVPAEQPMRHHP